MKIQTKQVLKDLAGVEVKSGTVGKFVSDILITPRQGRSMEAQKAFGLAMKFYNDEEVDLDDADFEAVKEEIRGAKDTSPLITGQLLSILNDYKDKK